jgi:hypothetical protein
MVLQETICQSRPGIGKEEQPTSSLYISLGSVAVQIALLVRMMQMCASTVSNTSSAAVTIQTTPMHADILLPGTTDALPLEAAAVRSCLQQGSSSEEAIAGKEDESCWHATQALDGHSSEVKAMTSAPGLAAWV